MSTINKRSGPALPTAVPLVAVVDDDASFRRSVGRVLDCAGYQVKTFESAKEFLSALSTVRPQCVVVDVHMPVMSGLELLDLLAERASSFPAIIVTAHDTPQTREHARKAGSCGFLLKPFDMAQLLDAVAEALGSRGPSATPFPPPPATGHKHPPGLSPRPPVC